MASRSKKRLFLSCLYLGILFLGAGAAYHYVQHFNGTLFLLPGTSESLVFAAADGTFRLGASQRGVAPDLLLFDNPRSVRALRGDQIYDGLVLPFSLRLQRVEILREHAPRHVLYIEGPDGVRVETVTQGAHVALADDVLALESIGPWDGLIRDSRGTPMATLTWGEADDATNHRQFLEAGRAYVIRPDLAVCFLWHESEAAGKAAFVASLEAAEGARWGVRDGSAVQWFENFIPGTGAVLLDGTRVTLADASRAEGWIALRIQRDNEAIIERVQANAAEDGARWLYEDPAGAGRILYLHAWREDVITARLLSRDAPVRESALAPGDEWTLPGDLHVAVNQVMGQALAVPGGQVRAAYVRAGGKQIALREGLAESFGEYRVRYQLETVPPDARYHVAALDIHGATLEERTLEAGDTVRIGSWIFALSPENPFAPHGIALAAVRRPGGLGHYAGLSLFVFGCVGLTAARFAPRR